MQVKHAGIGRHADGNSLYLQVSAAGARSWIFRYKLPGTSKLREMGLGSAAGPTAVPLSQARLKAVDLLKTVRAGIDPLAQRDVKRTASKTEDHRAALQATTFRVAADQYIRVNSPGWRNPKHRQQWRNTLETYAFLIIGDLPVASIDTVLVVSVLLPIWSTKPETASRVRGRIEAILDATIALGQRTGPNPAQWKGALAHVLPPRGKVRQVKHHAALPYAETGAFMANLRAIGVWPPQRQNS